MNNKIEIQDICQLTPMQEGMLFYWLKERDSNEYFESVSISLHGNVNIEILEKSFNILMQRHDVLRSVFKFDKTEKPLQIILKKRNIKFIYKDIWQLDESEQIEFIDKFNNENKNFGFDLRRSTLMRVTILRLSENTCNLIWSYHHIIIDGWSFGILAKDLFNIYDSLKNDNYLIDKNTIPYSNYIKWLQKQDQNIAIDYWENYLNGYQQQAVLAVNRVKSNDYKYAHESLDCIIEKDIVNNIQKLSKKIGVTISTFFQVLWGLLLQKYNDTNDVVFGTVVSGRPSDIECVEQMVGLFINTLPIRIKSDRQMSVVNLLMRAQEQTNSSKPYEYCSLADIQSHSDLKNKLFDHIMVFENYPLEKETLNKNSKLGFTINDIKAFEQTNYDLNITIFPGEEFIVNFSYNAHMYNKDFILNAFNHLKNIFDIVLKQPDIYIEDISVLSEEEASNILYNFNYTSLDYNETKLIIERFEEQVNSTPNKIAVMCGELVCTYQELNIKANKLARTLSKEGVTSNVIVGLLVERSLNTIVSIIAILKAGGAYLPIDVDYPDNRINYMLEDCNVNILITNENQVSRIKTDCIILDLASDSIYDEEFDNLKYLNYPTDLAYIIYTSGSTGKPKGVMIEHCNLLGYVNAFDYEFKLGSEDVFLQQASSSFDAFVEEMYPILLCGGKIVIASKQQVSDVNLLSLIIKDYGITIISASPLVVNELNKLKYFYNIHTVISGGDILKQEYISNLIGNVNVYNTYGPTESTVCATYYKSKEIDNINIPIGKPIRNYQIYILDKDNNLQPIGVAGEICIGGVGIARGYFNRFELTNEKFISNPFIKNDRLYKTGDIGRWMCDGNIEFIARKDYQVNIRGFRVELGEIENKLMEHYNINEAVVLDEGDKEEQYLCAYVVSDKEITVKEIRNYLGTSLPSYMIPSYFVRIDKIPVTTNGKIDRKSLSNIKAKISTGREYMSPQTHTEIILNQIWSELLGVNQISTLDDFFELGGQSLKATTLVNRINREFNVNYPLSKVFEKATIKEMAEYISELECVEELSLEKTQEKQYYPVSAQQKRLFILNKMDKDSLNYNMPAAFILTGDINLEKIEKAFSALINRHEILRTSFHMINDEILQKINNDIKFNIEYVGEIKEYDDDFIYSFSKPFDLSKSLLIRAAIAKVSQSKYLFIFDMHHIITDGISIEILIKELKQHLNGISIDKPKLQYKDYVAWQCSFINTLQYEKQKQYWLSKYADDITALNIPTDFPRTMEKSYKGETIVYQIEKKMRKLIRELAEKHDTTEFVFLYSIYCILLSKYTSQEDIIIGIPVSGRRLSEIENNIGMFVNTLAIRNNVDSSLTFKEYLENIRSTMLEGLDNQDYPLEELIQELKLPYDTSRNQLFDTMFSLDEENEDEVNFGDFKMKAYEIKNKISKFDFGLDILIKPEEMLLKLNYCSELFNEKTMKSMLHHYINILNQIINKNNIKLCDIEIISEEEKDELLYKFNKTGKSYNEKRPIHKLIESQVNANPKNIAVSFKDQNISYWDLNTKANALALQLVNLGIKKGSFVPVIMERSIELVISLFAIMKVGATFITLDINWPKERLHNILEDLNSNIILINENTKFIDIDIVDNLFDISLNNLDEVETNPNIDVELEDSIYIIYTSGSTGMPKGVVVPHRGILNRFLWMNDYFGKESAKSILQTTNHIYDSSVWQFFWPLINGGKTIIPDEGKLISADYISRTIYDHKITLIDFVPSIFNTIVNELKYNIDYGTRLMSLSNIIIGGEEMIADTVYLFQNLYPYIKITNLYGPTEASIGCVYHKVRGDEGYKVPIGKPISNVNIYILDKYKKLVPVGIPGEIYISGICLADKYLNNEAKTKEVFVENPFSKIGYERAYKTGDLAKYNENGEVIFLGRLDEQIKMRGFRIEPGEIQAKLKQCPKINEALVILQTYNKERSFLCAYIVGDIKTEEIKEFLSESLPYYMIPSYYVFLDSLPITKGGKVNKKLLPVPNLDFGQVLNYEAPRNYIEQRLVNVWTEVLNISTIGINSNFFEIGGNSLTATLMVSKIKNLLGIELIIQDIFKFPTINKLYNHIREAQSFKGTEFVKVQPKEYYDLSPSQKRLMVIDNISKSTNYNMPKILIGNGEPDIIRLQLCMNQLIQRHESFRTSFHFIEGCPVQRIADSVDFTIDYIEDDNLKDINQRVKEFIRLFNLAKPPLIRMQLIKCKGGEHILMIDMHHIISDGITIDILLEEFNILFQGNSLHELKYQYKDYTDWNKRFMLTEAYQKQKKYWIDTFSEPVSELNFPSDYTRTLITKNRGNKVITLLDNQLSENLSNFIKKTETTIFMALLAVFNVLLHRYTLKNDIVIGVPVSGRTNVNLNRIIGMFVNTLPLRNYPSSDKTFMCFLEEVKNNTLIALDCQEYPFDDLVSELKIDRDFNRNPLFDVMFCVEKFQQTSFKIGQAEYIPYDFEDDTIKFDIMLSAIEKSNGIELRLEYNKALYKESTMSTLLTHFITILECVLENPVIKISQIAIFEDLNLNFKNIEEKKLEVGFDF